MKLNSGWISFQNYSNQLAIPFKIYADLECILKRVESVILLKAIVHAQKKTSRSYSS